ncbi:MAG TPA: hypothetical protein DCS93_02715 [Microscillaceae bacterium]|nr:hypothetical protein [Microscillaceae bacterium]
MPIPQTVPAPRFYPTLASVVDKDQIPDALGFLKDSIDFLLNKVHYKDLQYTKSPNGDSAHYSLSIVSRTRLDIEIPGTGIYLVLNPDLTGGNVDISAFPITIAYEWKVLAYLRSFDLSKFDFSPKAFFETALRVLGLSEKQAIAHFINIFTEPVDEETTSLQQFVTDINEYVSENIPLPDQVAKLEDVIEIVYDQTQQYATLAAFGKYILTTDLATTKENLERFFRALLPQDIETYIKDILIPKFRATLLLSAAIEFPRSILQPVYPEDHPNSLDIIPQDPSDEFPDNVLISFGEALFYADTAKGFGYTMDIVLNTLTPAMIGNTGLIIDIQNLKIDLSKTENIAEADQENRPNEFMGVYIERTDIFLPKKWFKQDTGQTLAITGERLLIGTGGMSGTIALRATQTRDATGNVTDYYSEYFQFNYPITALTNGTEVVLSSHDALLNHINGLTSRYQLRFKYPLQVVTNQTTTFESESEYNAFLSSIDPDKYMWFNLGRNPDKAWRLGFNRFDISFYQGRVTESNLKARLEIPKFTNPNSTKAIIDLEGHWKDEDDFYLTAAYLPDGLPINLFGVLTLNLLSAELGSEDGRFFIGASCELSFNNPVMKGMLKERNISLPNIRIYEDGSLEITGGNASIPVNIPLGLGPVDVNVTTIHFGSHQQEYNGVMRKYNYFGFDGAISLDPLGIDARGEGLKFYYTSDNDEYGGDGDSFLHIQTIEVDLIIPGDASPESATAIINGMLSIPAPGSSEAYEGQVSFKLPQSGITGGASMTLQPRYPAFLLDAHVDLPAPIPVGPLGVYGFKGLLGFRYVAEKEAVGLKPGQDTWYDYYTYPPKGVHHSKFSSPEETEKYKFPFSIGAGAVLGTSFDGGTSISVRTMMLLSLPSLFLIEGRASILSSRLGLTDDREPPFFAFIAWGDRSIEMGMGADFKIPQNNGRIFDLYAEAQAAFFFDNPSNWYINLGTQENPNTARVLSLFTAKSYLMISAQGIQAGARAELDIRRRFGPARVRLYAYIELGGLISFERFQLGGYIKLGGMVDVDIWIIGVSLELNTILSAEAAEPFLLYAEFRVRACARIIFKKVCRSFKIRLKWEKNGTVNNDPIAPLPHPGSENKIDRTKELVQGVHMLTNESFALDYLGLDLSGEPDISNIHQVIPLDTYIDIKTVKGLIPGAVSTKIGGHTGGAAGYTDLIPPRKVMAGRELRQVKHKYSIEDINIKAWNGTKWINYHPFEALIEASERGADTNKLKIGYWQRSGEQYNAIRLLATTPFSFTEASEPGWFIPEQYGITASELFCKSTPKPLACANFLNKEVGTRYYAPIQYKAHYINGAYFTLDGERLIKIDQHDDGSHTITKNVAYFEVTDLPNSFSDEYDRSLCFDKDNKLIIILPEPSVEVRLKLNTHTQGVTITYYKTSGTQDYQPVYEQITEQYISASNLDEEIIYPTSFNETDPVFITKIMITPGDFIAFIAKEPFSGALRTTTNVNNAGLSVLKTTLQQVCWMGLEDFEYNLTIPGQNKVDEEQQDMKAGAERTIQPIWRPNTNYYIHFRLKDEVDNGARIGTFDYYYGFKTAGPVGHFHNEPGVTYGDEYAQDGSIANRENGKLQNPDKYPLTSLRQYIDYNRSYPNADGNLLQAKPLFYDQQHGKIDIYFSKPLAYHMLSGWPEYGPDNNDDVPNDNLPPIAGELNIAIKDPATNIIIPYPLPADYEEGVIPRPTPQWQDDQDPRIPLNLQGINQLIHHITNVNNGFIDCTLTLGEPISPASKTYTVSLTHLKPRKLYTALLYNAFDKNASNSLEDAENVLVHQFVFQTSRYPDFKAQVESYILKDPEDEQEDNSRQAIFDIPLPLGNPDTDPTIDTLFALVNEDATAGGSDLATQYPHLFERAIEGVLGLPPMDPAQTTEFNLIKNSDSEGDIIAILIRNPEPFNIPKIPIEEMKRIYNLDGTIKQENVIEVMIDSETIDENYTVLHSKDYSQALVMCNSVGNKITATSLNFQFKYKTWDGQQSAYVTEPGNNIYIQNIQLN